MQTLFLFINFVSIKLLHVYFNITKKDHYVLQSSLHQVCRLTLFRDEVPAGAR